MRRTGTYIVASLSCLILIAFYIDRVAGQEGSITGPEKKLTKADKKVMALIHKKYPIDKKTFMNTTPGPDYPYWTDGLRRYQAMDEDWLACDPPGPPQRFVVTRSDGIFRAMAEALTAIKYVPKDENDALKTAVMITAFSAPAGVRSLPALGYCRTVYLKRC